MIVTISICAFCIGMNIKEIAFFAFYELHPFAYLFCQILKCSAWVARTGLWIAYICQRLPPRKGGIKSNLAMQVMLIVVLIVVPL